MPKLQRIKRSNGSLVFSVNIPLEVIEELEWKKGSELQIERVNGRSAITVFKDESKKEGEADG